MDKILRVYDLMQKQDIEQLIICDKFSIFYLIGKFIDSGERLLALYIDAKNKIPKLIINRLFTNEIIEMDDLERIIYSTDDQAIEILAETIRDEKTLIDKNFPAKFLLPLISQTHNKYFVSDILERARLIKTHQEIDLMRETSQITDKIILKLMDNFRDDITELECVDILNQIKKDFGLTKFSFEPIIGFGKNAAEPHHVSNNTKLKPGDCIVIDIGFIKNNYCSDMTRTVFYKYASDFDKNIYDIVLQANLKAIKKVKPGVSFGEIDSAARDYIKQKGYGEDFMHTTGHSIGLECHEFGTVRENNHDLIKPGMIFSIEPGIYLENQMGVRIEDLVLVTENGYEILNQCPKDLRIIN